MSSSGSPARRACQLFSVALLTVAAAAPARAGDEDAEPPAQTESASPTAEQTGAPEEPFRYQGAYWGVQLHGGIVHRQHSGPGETPGFVYGASFRIASVLSLADFQLTILRSAYDAGHPDGEPLSVGRISIGVEGHLHPLFTQILKNDTFHYWLAGLYLSLGIDLDITTIEGRGLDRLETDPGWHIGLGTDYPLTDPNVGWSIWLGVAYRMKFLGVASGVHGLHNFMEHTVFLTLGYRNNNIYSARIPRPTEFDYRDPPTKE